MSGLGVPWWPQNDCSPGAWRSGRWTCKQSENPVQWLRSCILLVGISLSRILGTSGLHSSQLRVLPLCNCRMRLCGKLGDPPPGVAIEHEKNKVCPLYIGMHQTSPHSTPGYWDQHFLELHTAVLPSQHSQGQTSGSSWWYQEMHVNPS